MRPFTKGQRFGILILFVILDLLLLGISFWSLKYLPIWCLIPLLGIWAVATFSGIYFVLARDDIRAGFAIVPEAHAMIITRMGAFKRVVVNWQGHTITKDGEIKKKKGVRRRFGGLICFCFPIEDVKLIQEDEGRKTAKISLRDRVVDVEIERAEDKDGVWAKLQGYIIGHVVNPYKLVFQIQPPWLPQLRKIFESAMRDAITKRPFLAAIREKKDMAQDMWKALQDDGVIQEWEERYGFKIKEFGIRNIDIEKPEHYEALLKEWEGTRKAEGVKAQAKGDAEAIKVKADAIKEKGDEGRLVVIADAMSKSPLAAAETVHAIPGLRLERLVGKAFGGDLPGLIRGLTEGLAEGLKEELQKKGGG